MGEMMDTIIALSSGSLPSGVAVVRLSGPKSAQFLSNIAGKLPEPRRASLRTLKTAQAESVDDALVLWFPKPASFTGEDVAELHLHGGKAVVAKVLEMATAIGGIRLAEAGEFSRRAFSNGKMDLTAAEGLADLIDAETEAQRKAAHYLASGGLRDLYEGWQERLLDARAQIEADIDFAEEDDVPGSVADMVWRDMTQLQEEITAHLESYGRAERIRDGFRISLIGRPNVGKSSLLNALAGSDRSIVSDEAGTTRDVVEVRLDLGGYLVLIADTAGLRDDAGPVEAEGMRRALLAARSSDLVLNLSDDDHWEELSALEGVDVLKVRTKSDLLQARDRMERGVAYVSTTDQGALSEFLDQLGARIDGLFDASQSGRTVKLRYIDHLNECVKELDAGRSNELAPEFRAESLRRAGYCLGKITGQHNTEDLLGRIFSSFCIGK